jgi:vacuolar iron transporter family protein
VFTSLLHPRELPDPRSAHEARATGVLRPVVFGANDGLVSNLALVMGVAGAQPDARIIVLAGVAGLLAGAFSMAVGEYVSVQSQQELLDYQMMFQRHQLQHAPEHERDILVRIYRDRGFTEAEATTFVDRLFTDPEAAARLLIHEEVGLDERSIGSPLVAGVGSFISFTLGAAVPLVPFLFGEGTAVAIVSLVGSLVALFGLGIGISVLTRRSGFRTGIRQLALGGVAAAVTYAVGAWIGVEA